METNNNDLKKIKILFAFQFVFLFLLIMGYYYSYEKYLYLFFIGLFIITILTCYYFYMMFNQIYSKIRNVIEYIDKKQEGIIMDGDIGLLYEKVMMLEKRNKAYEEVIKREKENLKKTIEDICHQMKTPLSSISINNELLMGIYDNEKININQKQIEKLKYLMNSLLTLAKLENDTIKFNFQKLPVSYLINLSIENINSLLGDKELILKDIQGEFYYDESWLVEAISNILKNCLEQDSVSKIKVSVEENNLYLKLKISDNGKGFEEKDLSHLFERFYKGKNSSKESVGIGLSLTKEIVRIHHGYIDVYNNHGACFELTFPHLNVSDKA